jgi:flagellar protein FliS
MFGSSPKKAADAYSKVGMETGMVGANPHKLITMLFEGAVVAISNASLEMTKGNVPAKGKSISHAISIIENGLRASLNKKVGGELAHNLDALYAHLATNLLLANIHNDQNKLAEVKKMLLELQDAWQQIAPDKQSSVAPEPPEPPAAKDKLAPRKSGYISA